MTLQDIIADIHALTEDVEVFERKYGVLSETFYELYQRGVEPDDDAWVLDWADWAGAYDILLERQQQYRRRMHSCATHHVCSSQSASTYSGSRNADSAQKRQIFMTVLATASAPERVRCCRRRGGRDAGRFAGHLQRSARSERRSYRPAALRRGN